MGEDKLHVIARLKAKPEKADELRAVLRGLLAPTHAEDGCVVYRMLENREDPTDFTFVEEWVDGAALEAHFQTAHIRSALERFPELLDAELDLRRYSEVG